MITRSPTSNTQFVVVVVRDRHNKVLVKNYYPNKKFGSSYEVLAYCDTIEEANHVWTKSWRIGFYDFEDDPGSR